MRAPLALAAVFALAAAPVFAQDRPGRRGLGARLYEPSRVEGASFADWTEAIKATAKTLLEPSLPPAEAQARLEELPGLVEPYRAEFEKLPEERRASYMRDVRTLVIDGLSKTVRAGNPADERPLERLETARKNAEGVAAALAAGRDPFSGAAVAGGPAASAAAARAPLETAVSLAAAERRERASAIALLQDKVSGMDGVSPVAVERARAVLAGMLEGVDSALLDRLRGYRVVITPKRERVTVAPEFSALHGEKSSNDVKYDKAAGIANEDVLVVSEADLLGRRWGPACSAMAHELGHAVQHNLPLDGTHGLLTPSLMSVLAPADCPGLSAYSRSAPMECVAEATAAFFGIGVRAAPAWKSALSTYVGGGWLNGIGQLRGVTAEELRKQQPILYQELVKLYGRPRDLSGLCRTEPKR